MTDFNKNDMRYSFYLMLILFISCEGKIDKIDMDYFSNMQFSLDTVIIDPGDEILFTKHQLLNADKDLNMLGETLVPQLAKKPGRHFAKDGKIWIYENMEDEMGFIRLGMSD